MVAIKVLGVSQPSLQLPDDFSLVAADEHERNGEAVRVERFQQQAPVAPYLAHVTLVYGQDGRLLSFNRFTKPNALPMPAVDTAQTIAQSVFDALDPAYAAGLTYMRTDRLDREFLDDYGQVVTIPVLWVKFAHQNGSYNWVSVGTGGAVVEFERESLWDYRRNRRATEEWNYDQWVQARKGLAAQPQSPEALA